MYAAQMRHWLDTFDNDCSRFLVTVAEVRHNRTGHTHTVIPYQPVIVPYRFIYHTIDRCTRASRWAEQTRR